jgi:hypothetical protein
VIKKDGIFFFQPQISVIAQWLKDVLGAGPFGFESNICFLVTLSKLPNLSVP